MMKKISLSIVLCFGCIPSSAVQSDPTDTDGQSIVSITDGKDTDTAGTTDTTGDTTQPTPTTSTTQEGSTTEGMTATSTTQDTSSTTEATTTEGETATSTTEPQPMCGNGQIDPGEECDEGKQTMTCDSDCTLAQCGDNHLNPEALEQCDNGSCTAQDGECSQGFCTLTDKPCNSDIPHPQKKTCSLNCNNQGASGNVAPFKPESSSPLD